MNGEWHAGAHRNETSFQARTELTELQLEYLDWLLDPSKDKGTQKAWCEAHAVTERAVQKWKKHPLFVAEWEKQAMKAYGGMERLTAVIDKLYDAAVEGKGNDGGVKAISLYLQYVDRYTPKRINLTEGTSVEDLSDEELAQVGENITRLRKERNG